MRLRSSCTALLLALLAFDTSAHGTLELRYVDGRVSLRAEQVAAKVLWQQLADAAGFRLHVAAAVGDVSVSGVFDDLPLAQALPRLLSPNDFAVFYATDHQPANQVARIADLFVFPPSPPARQDNAATAALPAEPDPRIEAQRLGRLIAEPGELALRRLAIADLSALNSPEQARGLEEALGASEPELRREVVQALGDVSPDIPPTALGQVILGDRDVQVRLDAVRALADLGGEVARLFIVQATRDQDASVREAARQALRGFNGRE